MGCAYCHPNKWSVCFHIRWRQALAPTIRWRQGHIRHVVASGNCKILTMKHMHSSRSSLDSTRLARQWTMEPPSTKEHASVLVSDGETGHLLKFFDHQQGLEMLLEQLSDFQSITKTKNARDDSCIGHVYSLHSFISCPWFCIWSCPGIFGAGSTRHRRDWILGNSGYSGSCFHPVLEAVQGSDIR